MRSAEQMKAIRERLTDLELQGGGRLTPNAVLDDAKDPDSPLHDSFEWDDEKAAHAHRIEQARALITSVRVVQRTDKTAVRAVFYVRDPSAENDEQGYVSTSTLRSAAVKGVVSSAWWAKRAWISSARPCKWS